MRNWVLAASALAMSCGDNSRACGVGTKVEGGFCVPSVACGPGTIEDEETGDCVPDGTRVCIDGTRFDPVTGSCQIDPTSCQDGTVLVDGACFDPTAELLADLEEAPEPNGLGVIEDSATPAGVIRLKASGAFVVHGSLAPHGDAPDVDTYQLQVPGPALLDISVDGVGGVAAGFGIGEIESGWPEDWRRFGIDLGSDTSRRRVYVPVGGIYELAVADVRSMFELATTSDVTDAGGAGTYYLSVSTRPLPASTTVGVPSSTTGSLAHGDVAFYQATFPVMHPAGVYRIGLAMPSEFAVGAVSMNLTYGTEVAGAPAGIEVQVNNGPYLITVDNVFAVAPGPVAFTLTIQ